MFLAYFSGELKISDLNMQAVERKSFLYGRDQADVDQNSSWVLYGNTDFLDLKEIIKPHVVTDATDSKK